MAAVAAIRVTVAVAAAVAAAVATIAITTAAAVAMDAVARRLVPPVPLPRRAVVLLLQPPLRAALAPLRHVLAPLRAVRLRPRWVVELPRRRLRLARALASSLSTNGEVSSTRLEAASLA